MVIVFAIRQQSRSMKGASCHDVDQLDLSDLEFFLKFIQQQRKSFL
jgi:hypothetical protein